MSNVRDCQSDSTQIIVKATDIQKVLEQLRGHGNIKYSLPMIDSYVVEVNQTTASPVIEQLEISDNIFVETDSIVTAQMKRAADIIHLSYARENKIYGEGVGVAILDTGIYLHPDFIAESNRSIIFKDFINGRKVPYDDNGHGTHVAGIVGGNGHESGGDYMGVAPMCNLIILKVLNYKGNGRVSDVLAGLQWVIHHKEQYNIRVVNISVGTASNDTVDETSLLVQGVNAVWDAGIVVVVAAGNNGPKPHSISTPGISRKVITVGAFDDDIPVDIGGGKSRDYSGRGPTIACIKKPDIVAPGSNICSCNAIPTRSPRNPFIGKKEPSKYTIKSGTSMATPIVSGAIALLLSKYPEMNTQQVKIRCKSSSRDLGYPWSKQGWGLLDVEEMLK